LKNHHRDIGSDKNISDHHVDEDFNKNADLDATLGHAQPGDDIYASESASGSELAADFKLDASGSESVENGGDVVDASGLEGGDVAPDGDVSDSDVEPQ
jgi:hypothetical protein